MAQPIALIRIQEPKAVALAKTLLKLNQSAYNRWLMTVKQVCSGFTYSAELLNYSLPAGVLSYDEIGSTDLIEYDKNKVINYVPIAYRDEFKKDVSTYTAKYLRSKQMYFVKQYGDVYVYYDCWLSDKLVWFKIYPSNPQINGMTLLVAKPNPNYKQ